MKTFFFTLTLITLLGLGACSSDSEGNTDSTSIDLTLIVGEELKLEEDYILAPKVKEGDNGLVSNVEVANESVVYGGGLISNGSELEIGEKTYTCVSISEEKLEFTLNK